MSTLLALSLLSAVDDARGSPGALPEEAAQSRPAARLHAAANAGVMVGLANYDGTGAVTLSGDLGVVLADRVSIYGRMQGGSLGFSVVGAFSVVAEVHLSDLFSVGLGVALQGWMPTTYTVTRGPFVGVMFPVRVRFAPFSRRADGAVQRSGLFFGLEVAPGVGVLPTPIGPTGRPADQEVGLTFNLGAGYGVW